MTDPALAGGDVTPDAPRARTVLGGATSDGAPSDGATSDSATSDSATSDGATSDGATSDSATSDSALSEEAAPGGATADDTFADPPIADEVAALGLDRPQALSAAVEAVLFVADAAISVTELAAGLRRPEPEIAAAVSALAGELDRRHAGIELRELAGGYRLYTRSEVAPAVELFLRDVARTRLSPAALETLAVIAYRQPVARSRIAAIRGVAVDAVVRTLLSRGLVTEIGADPDTGAGLYATTDLFLEKIGLTGLDQLPSLAPLLPGVEDLDADDGLDLDA